MGRGADLACRHWGGLVIAETLVETEELSIVRVHGRPREPEQGRHRRAVVYVGVETPNRQLVGLLRDAAERLEKTLTTGARRGDSTRRLQGRLDRVAPSGGTTRRSTTPRSSPPASRP